MASLQDRVRAALRGAIAEVAGRPEECARDPARDFTRDRKLPLPDLILTITTMGTGTLGNELLRAFGMSGDAPSAAALSQQWAKLNDRAMPALHEAFLRRLEPAPYLGRYELLAVDGTEVAMAPDPRDAQTRVPGRGGAREGRNCVHATCLFDVGRGVYVDMVVQGGRSKDEHAAAAELVGRHRAPPGLTPVLLADRGFYSLNLFDRAARAGVLLLVRAADDKVSALLRHELGGRPVSEVGELDVTVERCAVRSADARWRSRPDEPWLYRVYGPSKRFDSLPEGPGEERWVTVRVVRARTPGGWLNLVTSLPASEFPARGLAALYRLRWREEVGFDELKHKVWDGRPHVRGLARVTQELWGRLTLHAACAAMLAEVPGPGPGRAADRAAGLWVAAEALRGARVVDVVAVCSRRTQAVRPGRGFGRRHRPKGAPSFTRRC